MTIEDSLYAALSPLVSGRAYPTKFNQEQVWPAIRYTTVSMVPGVSVCGDSGEEAPETRIQIDIVAPTFAAMRALRAQTMAALQGFDPPAVLELAIDDYDAEVKQHRGVLDYVLHPSSQ